MQSIFEVCQFITSEGINEIAQESRSLAKLPGSAWYRVNMTAKTKLEIISVLIDNFTFKLVLQTGHLTRFNGN